MSGFAELIGLAIMVWLIVALGRIWANCYETAKQAKLTNQYLAKLTAGPNFDTTQ